MRLLPTILFLSVSLPIAALQSSSPTVNPKKPVINNSDGNLKDNKTEEHQPGKAPLAGTANTVENDPTSRGSSTNQVYSVKVVSQPASRRDPWFVAYVILTGLGILIGLATLGLVYRQTGATKVAANAAKRSADVAERTLEISERADILVTRVDFYRGEHLEGKDSRVKVEFKNFGRTRAINTKLRLNLIAEGIPPTNCEQIPPITVGAGNTRTICSQRFIEFMTKELAMQILNGGEPFRFEAEATYEDVFDHAHRTYSSGTLDLKTDSFILDKEEAT